MISSKLYSNNNDIPLTENSSFEKYTHSNNNNNPRRMKRWNNIIYRKKKQKINDEIYLK